MNVGHNRGTDMSPRTNFSVLIHDTFTHGYFYHHPFDSFELEGKTVTLMEVLLDLLDDREEMPNTLCEMMKLPANSTYRYAAIRMIKEMEA